MLTVRNGVKVEVWQGDITRLDVMAIVNAANVSLRGSGGVDAAIHRAAGSEMLSACLTLGQREIGSVCTTPGFKLAAKWVLHAVGPVWRGGEDDEALLLASCYLQCMQFAAERKLTSIAFPAISCGSNHFPLLAAANIAWNVVEQFLVSTPSDLQRVVFVAYDDEALHAWQRVLVGLS